MKNDALLNNLIQSPKLVWYYEQIQEFIANEREKRLQFYANITEEEKAEFINGAIVIHSPVRSKHNNAGLLLVGLLNSFVYKYDLGYVGYEKIMVCLARNDYEPDICFFDKSKSVDFTPEQTLFPAPDFVVEILSPTTEARDRGIKFIDYADSGVREYWIIDADLEIVEQYILQEGEYRLIIKSNSGDLSSVAVPNFHIPIRAIFDPCENLRVLQDILIT
jgi:Uma2 family endonuclease